MDWLSNIDTGGIADAASSAAANIWDGVSDFATGAFTWIGENPEAANLIGGVALGAAQGYMADRQARDQRAFEREMYDKRREDRMAKPGEVSSYDSHLKTIAGKGLLSSGMITGEV